MRSRNFVSSSEGRPPNFRKKRGVRYGSATKAIAATAAKATVRIVKGANSSPRAMTVPRSVMKHAARTVFPKSVLFSPNSSMTAYTTATEVVESATPASQLARTVQPRR